MEAGPTTSAAAGAAPKRGALWITIAIVIAVALTAGVMDLAVFPALQAPQTGYVKYNVTTVDVGYDRIGFNPQLTAKAGQIIIIELYNNGTQGHEFLLFSGDRTAILTHAYYALHLAESHHPGYATNDSIGNDTLAEYSTIHDSWANLSRVGCAQNSCVDHNVDSGATNLFWFVVNTPGTYFFACHMVDRTNWKIHQDKGMWGTLIVS